MPLPFLFVAEYDDGSVYHQTTQDVSRQNPMKSAFYDIRQLPMIPEEQMVKFGLIRLRQRPLLIVTVDLRTGNFAINGTVVPVAPAMPRKREGIPLGLIYERRNELHMTSGEHKITYRIGWRCESDWLALALCTHPERITLHGSHETGARAELHAALVG